MSMGGVETEQPDGTRGHAIRSNIFEAFCNPPRSASVNPFWFWQGELDASTLIRQVDQMTEQGVTQAIVHNRSGLQTPYLSDEYFAIVRALLDHAEQAGFRVNFVDEFNWPAGQGWDIWRPEMLSRVLAKNPDARLRGIRVTRSMLEPGQRFVWTPDGETLGASVLEWNPETGTVSDVVRAVFDERSGAQDLVVPDGACWLVLRYGLEDVVGVDGGLVDLMNPDAVDTFLHEVHDLYEQKVGDFFGTVIGLFYLDHEGDYGARIPWTPRLNEEFQRRKGYHVFECIPYLLYDSPVVAPSRRFDFLDVVSDLYVDNFWGRIARWCEDRKLDLTGHGWEESLWNQAAFTGSLFRVQRALPLPGVDSLLERGRSPREIKESSSVAHFESKGLSVENQGVLGIDSYLDPERMKVTTNTLAAWGTTMFIPHAFNYNPARVDWPEDWFVHQPYWPYFHHYARHAQRLAFMNTVGVHTARVLLYTPLDNAWAASRRIFNADDFPDYRINLEWGTEMDEVEGIYSQLMEGLVTRQIDFDVTDWEYLGGGEVIGSELQIGPERFQAIVLPPMTYMSLDAAHRLLQWARAGGTVVAVGQLPSGSTDRGNGDPEMKAVIESLFQAPDAPGFVLAHRDRSGIVDEVAAILDRQVGRDFRVEGELQPHIRYTHRVDGDLHIYLVVNDSDCEGPVWITCDRQGAVERWNPDTGEREEQYWEPSFEGATRVRCWMRPWDAFYLVFSPHSADTPTTRLDIPGTRHFSVSEDGSELHVSGTVDRPIEGSLEVAPGSSEHWTLPTPVIQSKSLSGPWWFRPEDEVPVPYAREQRSSSLEEGLSRGWADRSYNDSFWPRVWTSRERMTIRKVWVAGPYPNKNHHGCSSSFAPEDVYSANPVDPQIHRRALPDGTEWRAVDSPQRIIDLDAALGTSGKSWVTGYALAYVQVPEDLEGTLTVVADNNVKLWLNGELLVNYHDHPFYLEMRDGFGITRDITLRAGLNTVLLKVSKGIHTPTGQMGFTLRFAGEREEPIAKLRNRTEPLAEEGGELDEWTWYRLDVPPGARRVRMAGVRGMRAWGDGHELEVGQDGLEIPVDTRQLTLVYPPGFVLSDHPYFTCDRVMLPLGSITGTQYQYYCGAMLYECPVSLSEEDLDTDWELDLGTVGSVAEVTVNGQKVTELPWQPYRVRIGSSLKPGENLIQVRVVNSRAASRAVADPARLPYFKTGDIAGPELLRTLERNGLIGPVVLRPYFEGVVPLPVPVSAQSH